MNPKYKGKIDLKEELLQLSEKVRETVASYDKSLLDKSIISVSAKISEQKMIVQAKEMPMELEAMLVAQYKDDILIELVDYIPVLKAMIKINED